jgi:hypothetical protein
MSELNKDLVLPIHDNIQKKINYFLETNEIPHIIFHGSSGTGKKTIVYDFLNKIYKNDKQKMKTNVMFVNCAHGKGIKFIREELKFFAKTNIQSNSGVLFKTIILLNADFLTIDAQSALRRCIELFSYNTRFFIIVENKHKLLNPILSRFCEIYVPEYIENGKIINLHQFDLSKKMNFREHIETKQVWIKNKMEQIRNIPDITHSHLVDLSSDCYENGISCVDLIEYIENTDWLENDQVINIVLSFYKIKSEYRCEKLLLLYLFDLLFFGENNSLVKE